ncbi:MAG: penicillin-binding transpeptidase domain-containing protein [Clostridiaceae bacterium]|nr:penicillin-binding transpeptidase domain-containing protein [Clostridiaceae bacterium]
MSRKQVLTKIIALSLVMCIVSGVLSLRLVYLQLVKGEEYRSTAARQTSVRYTIKASRGEILDKNGKPLVSNELSYSVQFDYYDWDKSIQNNVILTVCKILNEGGVSHYDTLPITNGYPFQYTYDSIDSADGKKLMAFIKDKTELEDLPTAADLFSYLCTKFEVDDKLDLPDKRLIVGVRYEMMIREFSAYTPFVLAAGADIDTVGHITQLYLSLPGVSISPDSSRKYNTQSAAHILGRVGIIYKEEYAELKKEGYAMNAILGKDGMEKVLEGYLRGIDGKETLVADISGNITDRYISQEPQPGDNCFLTIDLDLQETAERALAETMKNIRENGKHSATKQGADAEGGAVVVIDVRTGDILAMASYPTYSLATFSTDYNSLLEDPLTPMFNRSISGLYPPGSTFKMVTAVAALEEGIITPSSKITDLGIYTYYSDYQPRCWLYRDTGRTHGKINVSEAIKYSCNYFFYEVGRKIGIETLVKYANELGLGQKTGIELANEKAGQVASPETVKDWEGGLVLAAAIGQSAHQFTPIQLANYVATIVNGGIRYRPQLLKKVMDYSFSEVIEEEQPEVLGTVKISQSTIDAVKEGMRGVVTEDGTASAVFRGYPIAVGGKTGSAQTSTGRSAHGVFVSFAPYDEPEIAVCVIGEYAGSGGSVAPVVVQIYNQYFGLNQPEEQEQQPLNQSDADVDTQNR